MVIGKWKKEDMVRTGKDFCTTETQRAQRFRGRQRARSGQPARQKGDSHAEALNADLAHLDALESEAGGRSSAKGSGVKATSDREAAMTALRTWDSRFKRMAKRRLKARPDLLSKLKIKRACTVSDLSSKKA